MDEWTVPRRRKLVRMRRLRDCLLVAGGDTLELTDAAEFVFRHIDGTSTVGRLADLLAAHHDTSREAAVADVAELVRILADSEIVELVPAAGGHPDVS